MPVTSGTRLGRYVVVSPLGQGGMGEVYRATDTSLGRDVAIKILASDIAHDPTCLERFRREARLLGGLTHPNVATVHGLECAEGQWMLIMELVPGPTLRELGRLGLGRSIEVASLIAAALEAAHAQGVVHRDLKPDNVKLAANGTVKVLDFGLAKSVASPPEHETIADVTRALTVLGTAGYMSPEQVTGKTATAQTDIWALGCVLYELLTGVRAFRGSTAAERLAATLSAEPDWTALSPATPSRVMGILKRCLAKEPARRYRDIGDVRLDLEDALDDTAATVSSARRRWTLPAVLAVVFATLVVVWLAGLREAPVLWHGEILGGPGRAIGPRISPDGRTLAFQTWVRGQNQVAILTPASGAWNRLTDEQADGSTMGMSWAHDGSRIYYDRYHNGIFSVPAVGGEPRRVLDNGHGPEAVPDGSLLFARVNARRQNQLHRYWPDGPRVEPLPALLPPPAEAWATPVRVFPDGREAAFFGRSAESPDSPNHLHVIDLDTHRVRRLAPDLVIRPAADYVALSSGSSGDSVLIAVPEGDLHRIVEIPRDGSNGRRTVLSLTAVPWFLDAATDGSIYVDQTSRPFAVLEIPAAGGPPNRLAESPGFHNYARGGALPLPDGRIVVASRVGTRERLLVTEAGDMLLPLIDTTENTSFPAAVLGQGELAFVEGVGPSARLAIASLPGGRIVRRLEVPPGEITALAAGPDGETVYAVVAKTVWAISARTDVSAHARRMADGDGVAVDPSGGGLIVQVMAEDGTYRLFRYAEGAEQAREIAFSGDAFFTYPVPLSPNAVARDGRILVHGGGMDTWNFRIGVIDPVRRTASVVPLLFDGDPVVPAWGPDGRIVCVGLQYRQTLWRFSPDRPPAR